MHILDWNHDKLGAHTILIHSCAHLDIISSLVLRQCCTFICQAMAIFSTKYLGLMSNLNGDSFNGKKMMHTRIWIRIMLAQLRWHYRSLIHFSPPLESDEERERKLWVVHLIISTLRFNYLICNNRILKSIITASTANENINKNISVGRLRVYGCTQNKLWLNLNSKYAVLENILFTLVASFLFQSIFEFSFQF